MCLSPEEATHQRNFPTPSEDKRQRINKHYRQSKINQEKPLFSYKIPITPYDFPMTSYDLPMIDLHTPPLCPGSQSTGPPIQSTGPPRTDAGVGIGLFRGIQKFD